MGVGDAEDFQDALQGAVLARHTVQHVEGGVRLEGAQHGGDVAADIDARHAVAVALQRVGAGLAGAQRNLALRGPASHQNRDVPAHAAFPKSLSGSLKPS